MTSRDQHLELLQQGIEAFNRGDESTLIEMFDPRIECRVGPGLMNTGTWHGHDGYRKMVTAWGEAWDSNETHVLSASAPDEHHVITEVHQKAVGGASGIPVEMTVFYLLEVRDGRAVRFHIYADRDSALAAIR
jgi:ketosteroid isomerase-like protein